VPTLIHLNGPPGIGKSTLSALYVDRHPGTLNLDIDRLHPLVGGWRDKDGRTHEVLRPVALAMAAAHLRGGRDVIVPQFRARIEEIEAFESVAREAGAGFREVVLLAAKDEAIARFGRRAGDSDWEDHNRRLVAGLGGPAFLGALYDQLLDVLRRRPAAVIIETAPGAIEDAYASLVRALAG
jgi:AAA domain